MTSRLSSVRFVVPIVAVVLAPILPAAAASGMSPSAHATSASYRFTLTIGMPEQMWTLAQVKAKHPKTGEVMLMGSMAGGMSMGSSQRHLEVHIYARSTGKPIAGGHPTISAVDASAKNAMPITVPVAEMEGVTSGAADVHYGNNVNLVGGHTYKVTVTLNGQRASLQATAPK